MTPPDAAAFIRAHLPVLPVPGLPEIHLHKAVPASGVGRLAGDEAPYWAHYWAGGLALARYILDHPERVAGRSEEHTSELQSLMRISYAVFCLKKKNTAPEKHG